MYFLAASILFGVGIVFLISSQITITGAIAGTQGMSSGISSFFGTTFIFSSLAVVMASKLEQRWSRKK